MPQSLLDEIDQVTTVTAELRTRNRYLPPRYEDLALIERAPKVASWFESALRGSVTPEEHHTVMARKAGGGSRPMTYWSLLDRLTFRALIDTLKHEVDMVSRLDQDYDAFVRSPLEIDCEFVLKADVAAYYQYIDHERLTDEVVAQTGDDLAIVAALELLQTGSRRRFGLPQMTDASDWLAELYINPVQRTLLRNKYSAFRYADDFRVACVDYNQALGALELIEREVHALGLVLNEAKTTTPHRNTYEESLGEVRGTERTILDSIGGAEVDDLDSFWVDSGYDREGSALDAAPSSSAQQDDEEPLEVTDSPDSIQIEAATKIIELWADQEAALDAAVDWSGSTRSVLVRKALTILTAASDPAALQSVTPLLTREPHLTPQICAYLQALAQDDRRSVVRALDTICGRNVVSIWQAIWLSHCAGSIRPATRGRRTESGHIAWLRTQLQSPHPALAAQAALALCRRRVADSNEIVDVLNRSPSVHRPTVIMALASLGDLELRKNAADNRLERMQAEWAATQWS